MYVIGAALMSIIGVVYITIRYLDKNGNTDPVEDVAGPGLLLAVLSIGSWLALGLVALILTTKWAYSRYKGKQ